VQKLWGLLFGVVLLACFLLTVAALFIVPDKWGLPTNIAAVYGERVDTLFYIILGLTGFFYVLTEAILVAALFLFIGSPQRRAVYSHGDRRLELAWTIVPAAILLYIAYAQISTWEDIKYQSRLPQPDQIVQVTAKQWEWRMRYRGKENAEKNTWELAFDQKSDKEHERSWGETEEYDDIHLVNDLHTWKGANVKILLKTSDILHSFFLPNLRLKQDALPGKTIPMWFKTTDSNYHFDPANPTKMDRDDNKHWELACAELCGGGHFRMRGRLIVHDSKDNYEAWLKYAKEQQGSRVPEARSPTTEE
jgi:cytochrome c oxidase subunit 2